MLPPRVLGDSILLIDTEQTSCAVARGELRSPHSLRRIVAVAILAGPVLSERSAEASEIALTDSDMASVMLLLLLASAFLTAMLLLFVHRRWTRRERALAGELERTRAELDRANLFLASEPQILVAWDKPDAEPRVEGEFALVTDALSSRRILAYGSWLEASVAVRIEEAVAKLLARGEAFSLTVAGLKGRHFEIAGRAIGGNAVMRIRDISGDRLQLVRLQQNHADTESALDGFRRLLDLTPNPAWTRDRNGNLTWTSAPYLRALQSKDGKDAPARAVELFDKGLLREAEEARLSEGVWRTRAPAIVAGERKLFDAFEVATHSGAVGIALDLTEVESLRLEMDRHIGAYTGMLDQLSTAVAIFDITKRLTFYNAAYRQIWSLDVAFLDSHPTDGEILDHLRAKRQLPEQADFRTWKGQTLAAYQAIDPIETVWHLPDGRTLRVVASPNPQGGVTYLFDDATQSFALATQLNALTRVQGETLDALKEGVAVFGADGRIRLINPAFATLWRLDSRRMADRPHIDEITHDCLPLVKNPAQWEEVRGAVVGLVEQRRAVESRIERSDGVVLDCTVVPLPDGGTLITFFDATAGANVERALTERNEALVSAEKLRNDFVKHVSYELRTPLTNIIGFTQLLADGGAGPLETKQIEYAGYIKSSSSALLAIINDILDLASIDAGALELRLEDVDVEEAMRAAAEGVQDRLREANIDLRIVATDGVGTLRADGRRVRQILFNLLSNAIGFSEPGQTVTLAAMRRLEEVVFKVSDRGRGIAPDALEKVFDRFESHSGGSRHRGPGLGLSIVRALVELHGGRVTIDSVLSEGTVVTCTFPSKSVSRAVVAV